LAGLQVLSMGMQINEARRDDQTPDVDDSPATQWLRGERGDTADCDANVADAVQPRLWIYDPPTRKNQVKVTGRRLRACGETCQ